MASSVREYIRACQAGSPRTEFRMSALPQVGGALSHSLSELMKLTGLASGSLYPMLARLEGAGWLTRGKESIDPRAAGRPARTHYMITGAAVGAARVQLAELSERYRPPVPDRLRPQGSTA